MNTIRKAVAVCQGQGHSHRFLFAVNNREIASSEAVAMSRAVKAYRKEKIPRRKIKELYAVARKL